MRPVRTIFLCALGVLGPALGALGQTTQTPDQVQEDWKLVVGTPNTSTNGPQITTTMSPLGNNTSGPFAAFDMNYREFPSYTSGGMQIQVWSGKTLQGLSSQGSSQLNTVSETITWTQQLSLSGGTITYGINNGLSTTWGKFGQGNGLLAVSWPSSLTSLSAYNPNYSISQSGATWQSNLVYSLCITQVRYYSGGQLILTDSNPKYCVLPP